MSAPRVPPARRTSRALLALLGLTTALLAVLLPGRPAEAAETVRVQLTDEGPVPAEVALPADGGTVRLINADSVPHQVRRAAGAYDSGAIAPGASADMPFDQAGTFSYEDAQQNVLDPRTFDGQVTVGSPSSTDPTTDGEPEPTTPAAPPGESAAPTTPPPAGQPPAPPPAAGEPPAAAPAVPPAGGTSPAPGATGGSGTTSLPGFGAGSVPVPAPLDGLLFPPSVAPLLPDDATAAGQQPLLASPPVSALPGPLPGNPTRRPLGLPSALAGLAVLGVASLLVRVLLAEPAARRLPSPFAHGPVPVTVD